MLVYSVINAARYKGNIMPVQKINTIFLQELETLLSSYLKQRESIEAKVNELAIEKKSINENIEHFNNAYIAATGKGFEGLTAPRTAADLAEELLSQYGELHVDKMLELMAEKEMLKGREIPKQSLVATLVRYAQSKKRFKRVKDKPNTFTLIKEKKNKVM